MSYFRYKKRASTEIPLAAQRLFLSLYHRVWLFFNICSNKRWTLKKVAVLNFLIEAPNSSLQESVWTNGEF